VALLLTITLGWKWTVSSWPGTHHADDKFAERKVTEFLVRNHFQVPSSKEIVFGMQLLLARSALCEMKVILSSSRGWHRDLINNLSAESEQTFVVFGGKIYAEQPVWQTVLDFLWSRLLSGWGLQRPPSPVITVTANRVCEAEKLPWSELAGWLGAQKKTG
jgi:hypothetical protein